MGNQGDSFGEGDWPITWRAVRMDQTQFARVLLAALGLKGIEIESMPLLEQRGRFELAQNELKRLEQTGARGCRGFPAGTDESAWDRAWAEASNLMGESGAKVRAREAAPKLRPIYAFDPDELMVLERVTQAFLSPGYETPRPAWL